MLTVENIATGYGKKQVLFDISFEVAKGEVVLLAGSNGSGKSTLLKAIYGLLPLWNDRGVVFDGVEITGKSTSTLLRHGLLYIPQKNNLFEELTVRDNLQMAGLILDKKLLKGRIDDMLSVFATLVPFLDQIPMKMSGGERQLLTLAMATLHQPKMILLDEPFNGLSSKNLGLVTENLTKLNSDLGVSLLIVEHRIKECLQIAHKIIALKLGAIFSEAIIDEGFNVNNLNPVFM